MCVSLIHPRQPNIPDCDGTIKVSQQPVTDLLRNVISVHLNPSSPLVAVSEVSFPQKSYLGRIEVNLKVSSERSVKLQQLIQSQSCSLFPFKSLGFFKSYGFGCTQHIPLWSLIRNILNMLTRSQTATGSAYLRGELISMSWHHLLFILQ